MICFFISGTAFYHENSENKRVVWIWAVPQMKDNRVTVKLRHISFHQGIATLVVVSRFSLIYLWRFLFVGLKFASECFVCVCVFVWRVYSYIMETPTHLTCTHVCECACDKNQKFWCQNSEAEKQRNFFSLRRRARRSFTLWISLGIDDLRLDIPSPKKWCLNELCNFFNSLSLRGFNSRASIV